SAYLIGFGTHSGTVTAATDWGGEMEFKTVRPSLPESWERVAHEAAAHMKAPGFMLGMRETSAELRRPLEERKLERAIGVIYRPESERASHYFSARLGQQFDEYIWFDESSAVQPIATHRLKGMPETYPFGLCAASLAFTLASRRAVTGPAATNSNKPMQPALAPSA